MPNWCSNRVDVYSENKTDLEKVLNIFQDKKSVFGKVIPEPKWDVAGSVEVEKEEWKGELESFTANFSTAWSPPEGICMRLRQLFPNVSISWFYDEPGMQTAGYL